MLKITGELNTEVGGLPVMPEINMEVALQPRMIQFSIAPRSSAVPKSRSIEIAGAFMLIAFAVRPIHFWKYSTSPIQMIRVRFETMRQYLLKPSRC